MATPLNPLLTKLRRALAGEPDIIPPGWKTAAAMSDEWGVGPRVTRELLRAGLLSVPPLIKTKKFRVLTTQGMRCVPHYTESKSGKSGGRDKQEPIER